ncbi:MAG: T9SS type A sorting domain-containing protein [Chitinophagales bacterium]|nr:T9SS type A sorting domain-containing protein [Chitinophagales bacterium]MDW8393976.1 T9SS type A sorting domain-containing protein [Chitinophagales bacterium]
MFKHSVSCFLLLIVCWSESQKEALSQPLPAKPGWQVYWHSKPKKSADHPGWYAQWREMKQDANGKLHPLPLSAIRQHQQQATPRNDLLFNLKEIGPYNIGGRTRALLLDLDNSSHLLFGAVTGGLWRSTDKGKTWQVVNDYLENINISSLAQDYFQRDVIYAGTSEPHVGFIGNGVYISYDRGQSFTQLPATDSPEFNYVYRVKTSPTDSGRLYIATASAGLWRSDDFGQTLYKIFDTNLALNDVEITPTGGVWIGVNNLGVFYSPSGDSGTFEPRMTGLPPTVEFRRVEMAIAPSDTNVMYVALENQSYNGFRGMFRTANYGQSWTEVGNPDVDFGYYMTFSWYSVAIAVKPNDPNFVIFGVGDLCFSKDGGQTWKVCLNIHVDHHDIVFNPDNPDEFFLGEDGGVYRLLTHQMHYTNYPLNTGYRTIQYYTGCFFPEGLSAYGGTQDNGTHATYNGSSDFHIIFGGDGAHCAVNQQFPNVSYVSYQNGMIHRTDNANFPVPYFYSILNELDANNDYVIDEGAWFINPYEINLVNGDYLAFITHQRLWHTLDGGFQWLPAMNKAQGGTPYAIGMELTFSPTVYVGGSNGLLYRIDDVYNSEPGNEVNLTGKVPQSITNDFIRCIAVHPANDGTIYLALSNYSTEPRIWKVTQAKTTTPQFTPISGNLPVGLGVNYISIDPQRPDSFFIAATDFGIYVSDDAGAHWYKISAFPNVITYECRIRPWDRSVFIFTHGRGMWTATLGEFDISAPDPPAIVHSSWGPNPATDVIRLRGNSTATDIRFYDVCGKLRLHQASLQPGESLNVAALAPGMYLVRWQAEGHSRTMRLLRR